MTFTFDSILEQASHFAGIKNDLLGFVIRVGEFNLLGESVGVLDCLPTTTVFGLEATLPLNTWLLSFDVSLFRGDASFLNWYGLGLPIDVRLLIVLRWMVFFLDTGGEILLLVSDLIFIFMVVCGRVNSCTRVDSVQLVRW